MASTSRAATHADVFAAIAAQRPEEQAGLIEPQPPQLPERFLTAGRSNPKAAFRPPAKLDTAEKLQRELERPSAFSEVQPRLSLVTRGENFVYAFIDFDGCLGSKGREGPVEKWC